MKNISNRLLTSLFLLIIIIFSFSNNKILILLIFFVSFVSLVEINSIFKKIYKNSNSFRLICFTISLLYMVYFSFVIILFLMNSFDIRKFTIIFLMLICVSTDVGGFVFGKLIGGKKLTSISPNKTYAGVVGSLLLSLALGYVYFITQNNLILFNVNLFVLIIIVSLVSQIGDLFISFLKRKAKIKDTGTLLPGHGGILDRIDGMIFALPVGINLISV